jgi:peptide/nickel transport system substrate-binding protein
MRRTPTALVAVLSAATVALAACTDAVGSAAEGTTEPGTPTSAAQSAGPTAPPAPTPSAPLVVETAFDHVTLDPTRQFERSGAIVAKALYETLTTLSGTSSTPSPGLAQFTISPEGNWLTLRLEAGRTFSDGTPITTDDVIFTLDRAQGLGGPTASVLGHITMTKVDDRTMTITSPGANFALPAILANPAFGILNSKVVKEHGGTIGPKDSAGAWLQTHSAGSGPYVLGSVAQGKIRLSANPRWHGTPPAHPEVVLRDASPARQLEDLEAGRADIALDLSPLQAQAIQLDPDDRDLTVVAQRSLTTAYLAINRSAKVNKWTADPQVAEAIRRGVDAPALAQLVAGGTIVANGLIPEGIVGALKPASNQAPSTGTSTEGPGTPAAGTTAGPSPSSPAPGSSSPGSSSPSTSSPGSPSSGATPSPTSTTPATGHDVAAAKAALKGSGYRGQPIPLVYAEDLPIQGVPTAELAEAIAYQLAEVGIKAVPRGLPASQALADYRDGKLALALVGWTPDYPDPENYLAFAPGHLLGLRAGWHLRQDPRIDGLTIAALSSVGADRAAAYGEWQRAMNAQGAFVPLIQPASHYAHGDRVTSLSTNPVWTIDIARTR